MYKNTNKKRVVIIGLGSIGQRYAKFLKEDFNCNVIALRVHPTTAIINTKIDNVFSWKEVVEFKPQYAFITNPTFLHIKTALKCASYGMHLFIEKPLSHSNRNIKELIKTCNTQNLTAYVAYCLRFHPVIDKLKNYIKNKNIYHAQITCKSYLPNWRPGINHLTTYSAQTKHGGGVLLDLSHEFDYIEFLFGKITKMNGYFDKQASVTVDAEDFADIAIKTERNIHVNLHLNFLSQNTKRTIEIDFQDGYCIGDLVNNTIVTKHGNEAKHEYKFDNYDKDKMYSDQIKYFFENIKNKNIMNKCKEASELLSKIITFKERFCYYG